MTTNTDVAESETTGAHVDPGIEHVTIKRPMNRYGALTVETRGSNATRQIVECASPELETTLGDLPSGTSIPLRVERVGYRGNAWRAVELVDRVA